MKRATLLFLLFTVAPSLLSGQGRFLWKGINPAELPRLSAFLNRFTSLGFCHIPEGGLGEEETIRFGLLYNYRFHRERFGRCRSRRCPHGELTMDSSQVTRALEENFGVHFHRHRSLPDSHPPLFYDGRRYHFPRLSAQQGYGVVITGGEALSPERLLLRGTLYEEDDPSRAILADFSGVLRLRTDGSLCLESLSTVRRPERFRSRNTP